MATLVGSPIELVLTCHEAIAVVQYRLRRRMAAHDEVVLRQRFCHASECHALFFPQQILVSLMRTCWQQDKDPFAYLALLMRSPGTLMLDIVPAAAQAAALLESKPKS